MIQFGGIQGQRGRKSRKINEEQLVKMERDKSKNWGEGE